MSSKRAVLDDAVPFGWKLVALGVIASILLICLIWRPIWAVPTAHFVLPAGFDGPFIVASRSDRRQRSTYLGRTADAVYPARFVSKGTLYEIASDCNWRNLSNG